MGGREGWGRDGRGVWEGKGGKGGECGEGISGKGKGRGVLEKVQGVGMDLDGSVVAALKLIITFF